MSIISTENSVNSEQSCEFSRLGPLKTETVVRVGQDTIKHIHENKDYVEAADSNIKGDEILNFALNQISQKFISSASRSFLETDPVKPLRMHISGEAGTGKSGTVEALNYLAPSCGKI